MIEEMEREAAEAAHEEKLTNNEMLHDEELEIESKKEALEGQITSIRLQLLENKKLEEEKAQGQDISPRDGIWIIKARQALLIKKRQLKKLNKKISKIKGLLYGENNEIHTKSSW